VTDQVLRDGDGFYVEAYLHPADEPGRAEAVSLAAVRAHGLRDTGFSVELRGDVVIEVNGRLGEDDGFQDLFAAGDRAPPLLRWLRGDESDARPTVARALAYANRYEAGVVRRVVSVPGASVLVAPGDRIASPGTAEYRAHVAYAVADHPTSSRAAYEIARRRLDGAVVDVS
jgi:hypothetical protein